MLDRFPRGQHSKAIEAPRTQAREVFVSFANRKWTADEGDFAMVGEVGGKIGAAVRIGNFAIAAQIDAAQNDATPVFVNEPSSFNTQSWQIHGGRLTQCPLARQAACSDVIFGGKRRKPHWDRGLHCRAWIIRIILIRSMCARFCAY